MSGVIRRTRSVCPVCLKPIPAEKVAREGKIYLVKKCPEHGEFSSVVWRGREDFSAWTGGVAELREGENLSCPAGCGLCAEHLRATCCTLLEVTDRCDLRCKFCFADNENRQDPPLDTVKAWLRELAVPNKTLVQLSGGEPAMRDDLPEIVRFAREVGCKYVQLNSNGIRIARDFDYAKRLADAGLSFVFMQFDGVTDDVYEKLRGRPLLSVKERAIENLDKLNIGVTLVPTLVPGVNTQYVGDILRYAVAHSPAVRGVHFQPVSYFGHMPRLPEDSDRYTLDELIDDLVTKSNGLVKRENIAPSACDHPLCGFHGDFFVDAHGGLVPLTRRSAEKKSCCEGSNVAERPQRSVSVKSMPAARVSAERRHIDSAEKNREFVARRWRRQRSEGAPATEDVTSFEGFLSRTKSHGFTVTAMAFQDAGNLDIERLRQCSLHVYKDGKHIPFCAYYLTPFGEGAGDKGDA